MKIARLRLMAGSLLLSLIMVESAAQAQNAAYWTEGFEEAHWPISPITFLTTVPVTTGTWMLYQGCKTPGNPVADTYSLLLEPNTSPYAHVVTPTFTQNVSSVTFYVRKSSELLVGRLTVHKSNDGGSTYVQVGDDIYVGNTSWGTLRTITVNDPGTSVILKFVNAGSDRVYIDLLTVNHDAALPIQLASFVAAMAGNGIELKWSTISELSNYGFFVERRAEREGSFSELPNSFVAGHGTTLQSQSYSFTDNTAALGVWHYRLRQVDLDGTVHFTEAVRAQVTTTDVAEATPTEFALSQNYPNPFNPSTTIRYALPSRSHVTLLVFNALGQIVTELVNGEMEAGYHEVQFDAGNLASGVYLYRMQVGTFVETRKLLLLL
jgi:hypothetical protein